MTPAAQLVIVVCVVVVSAVLVWTLVAVRKTAARADTVLSVVEQQVRPMLGQIESLTTELRHLAATADQQVQRIGLLVRRFEEFSTIASRVVGTVGGFTRVGQYATLAAGLRRGLDEFLKRLKTNR